MTDGGPTSVQSGHSLGGLDRVLTVDPGRAATAVRNIPSTLAIFDDHFPRFPVLPGVLLLDSMAQLAALALGFSTGQWRLTGAEVVRFRHFVRPGDQAELAVRVLGTATATGDCDARVTVDGRLVATARRLRLARVTAPAPVPTATPAAATPAATATAATAATAPETAATAPRRTTTAGAAVTAGAAAPVAATPGAATAAATAAAAMAPAGEGAS